jgi:hypothetical protein
LRAAPQSELHGGPYQKGAVAGVDLQRREHLDVDRLARNHLVFVVESEGQLGVTELDSGQDEVNFSQRPRLVRILRHPSQVRYILAEAVAQIDHSHVVDVQQLLRLVVQLRDDLNAVIDLYLAGGLDVDFSQRHHFHVDEDRIGHQAQIDHLNRQLAGLDRNDLDHPRPFDVVDGGDFVVAQRQLDVAGTVHYRNFFLHIRLIEDDGHVGRDDGVIDQEESDSRADLWLAGHSFFAGDKLRPLGSDVVGFQNRHFVPCDRQIKRKLFPSLLRRHLPVKVPVISNRPESK